MMRDYEVTLKFRIGTDDPKGLDCPTLTKMLDHRLTSYMDGRRSFDVEMVLHGLIAIIRTAFRDCIDAAMIKLYDRQIVDHGNGRRTSQRSPHVTLAPGVGEEVCGGEEAVD
jgi:hypothetical protein